MNIKIRNFVPVVAVGGGILALCIVGIAADVVTMRWGPQDIFLNVLAILILCCFASAIVFLCSLLRRFWEGERAFRKIFEQSPNGIFLVDQQGRIIEWNFAQEKITGVPHRDAVGACIWDVLWRLMPPEQQATDPSEAVRRRFVECLTMVGSRQYETEIVTAGGERKVISRVVFPVKKVRTVLFGSIWRDISGQKAAEKKVVDYQARLRSLSSELALVEERGRRHLAICLHDSVGQLLALLKMKVREARSAAAWDEIPGLIDECIQSTRSLTSELSPTVLYELGFPAAVEWLAERMRERGGLACRVVRTGPDVLLPDAFSVILFRAVRELLMNVVKYAAARTAVISIITGDGAVEVRVEDDGRGFNCAILDIPEDRRGGFGLFTIREQLTSLGGTFTIDSKQGGGTKVRITVPVNRRDKNGHQDIAC
jgi:PAS domain S-box-containing protein